MSTNCIVKRDNQGKILKVLDPITGQESKLFNDLVKTPHIEGSEQAVDIYNEILKVNLDSFRINPFRDKDRNGFMTEASE